MENEKENPDPVVSIGKFPAPIAESIYWLDQKKIKSIPTANLKPPTIPNQVSPSPEKVGQSGNSQLENVLESPKVWYPSFHMVPPPWMASMDPGESFSLMQTI